MFCIAKSNKKEEQCLQVKNNQKKLFIRAVEHENTPNILLVALGILVGSGGNNNNKNKLMKDLSVAFVRQI